MSNLFKRLALSSIVAASFALATILPSFETSVAQDAERRPLVGVLAPFSQDQLMDQLTPFHQRLGELGYTEGENIFFEYRFADNDQSRLPALADELVEVQPDVIYALGTASGQAITAATTEIPIVVAGAGDLVAAGWAENAGHPGGNVTGVHEDPFARALTHLELALELVPDASRVGALLDAGFVGVEVDRERYIAAADSLGVQLVMVEFDPATGPDAAFERLHQEGVDVLLIRNTAAQRDLQARLVELTLELQLPAISSVSRFVDAGGLASIGPSTGARPTLAADFVDQILKGDPPAEIPLVPDPSAIRINLGVAQSLGMDIGPELRARAELVE